MQVMAKTALQERMRRRYLKLQNAAAPRAWGKWFAWAAALVCILTGKLWLTTFVQMVGINEEQLRFCAGFSK